MTPSGETLSERDEIEMLLPWYATGRLDAADRVRVDQWLQREPELRRQLELVRDEHDQTVRSNEARVLPASVTVEQTLRHVDQQEPGRKTVLSFLAPVRKAYAAPTARGVRWAAAVATVLFLAQSALVVTLMKDRQAADYQTASGGTPVQRDGSFALVRFADTTTAKDIDANLNSLGMSIVEGPRAGGIFRIQIGATGLSEQQRNERMAALRAYPGFVVFISPTP
jgi:anti-sigma factor RsiW